MGRYLDKLLVSGTAIFKGDPRRLFVLFFTPVLILSAVNFVDFFFLPTHLINDQIVARKRLQRKSTVIGYKYVTQKGYHFTTSKAFIAESDIDLEHTQIFGSVTFVDSDRKEYTDQLSSNLNGILKYFHMIFFVSMSYGIFTFVSNRAITKNSYRNIVYFNSIMFLVLMFMLIFN